MTFQDRQRRILNREDDSEPLQRFEGPTCEVYPDGTQSPPVPRTAYCGDCKTIHDGPCGGTV